MATCVTQSLYSDVTQHVRSSRGQVAALVDSVCLPSAKYTMGDNSSGSPGCATGHNNKLLSSSILNITPLRDVPDDIQRHQANNQSSTTKLAHYGVRQYLVKFLASRGALDGRDLNILSPTTL